VPLYGATNVAEAIRIVSLVADGEADLNGRASVVVTKSISTSIAAKMVAAHR